VAEPTSSLGKARKHLRTQLADSAAFRSWAGAANQSQALAHIYYESLPSPAGGAESYSSTELTALWPYAVIYVNDYTVLVDSQDGISDSGEFGIQLVQDIDTDIATDPDEVAIDFDDAYATIMTELGDSRGTAGYLNFESISLAGPPQRAKPDDEEGIGDEIQAELLVAW